MCLDLWWNSGFLMSLMADWLSHISLKGGFQSGTTSETSRWSQTPSFVASQAAMNSASVVDSATHDCLWLLQETGRNRMLIDGCRHLQHSPSQKIRWDHFWHRQSGYQKSTSLEDRLGFFWQLPSVSLRGSRRIEILDWRHTRCRVWIPASGTLGSP